MLDVNDVKVILISVPLADARSGDDPLRRHRSRSSDKLLVIKSTIHYRAAFEPHRAARSSEVDAPGLSSSNLARFDFKRIRRPIFPLDPDTTYP